MQIDGGTVVIHRQITDNPLPGDLDQLAGLVLVVVPLVDKAHAAALEPVEHADRSVDFPGVVGMRAA